MQILKLTTFKRTYGKNDIEGVKADWINGELFCDWVLDRAWSIKDWEEISEFYDAIEVYYLDHSCTQPYRVKLWERHDLRAAS